MEAMKAEQTARMARTASVPKIKLARVVADELALMDWLDKADTEAQDEIARLERA
jgi:hypothetical protein